jgi:hypothetical protein
MAHNQHDKSHMEEEDNIAGWCNDAALTRMGVVLGRVVLDGYNKGDVLLVLIEVGAKRRRSLRWHPIDTSDHTKRRRTMKQAAEFLAGDRDSVMMLP